MKQRPIRVLVLPHPNSGSLFHPNLINKQFSQYHYHATPELAHVEKHVRSDMLAQKAHDNDTG